MPFQFPDPSVQTEIVHPVTGEQWHYVNGAWEVEDSDVHTPRRTACTIVTMLTPLQSKQWKSEVDQNEEQLQAVSTTLLNLVNQSR